MHARGGVPGVGVRRARHQLLDAAQDAVHERVVALQGLEHRRQVRVAIGEQGEQRTVLAGVVAPQRRAERQAVHPQVARALGRRRQVVAQAGQLLTQPDVDLDELVAEGSDVVVREGWRGHARASWYVAGRVPSAWRRARGRRRHRTAGAMSSDRPPWSAASSASPARRTGDGWEPQPRGIQARRSARSPNGIPCTDVDHQHPCGGEQTSGQ